ncbi:MAG: hypothetical protein WA125_17345 [Desulfosporosinus sp.]
MNLINRNITKFLNANPRYKGFGNNNNFCRIFEFLSSPESILAMANACKFEKPALFGVISKLEKDFKAELISESELKNFNNFKQAVGSLVGFILAPYGFIVNKQRTLPDSEFFRTATHFILIQEKAEIELPDSKRDTSLLNHNEFSESDADDLTDENAVKIFETLCITKGIGNTQLKQNIISQIKKLLVKWL